MTVSASAPDSVLVRLPSGWLEVDPRCEDLVAEFRRTAHDQWGDRVDDDLVERLSAPLVAELRRLTEGADILLVGCYAEVVEVDERDVPLVLTANAVLAMSPPIAGLAEVRRELATSGGGELRIVTVDLPAGQALLAAGRINVVRPEWTDPVPALMRRYFLPVPGLRRVVALSMLTPNVDLAEEFGDVFDAIAETITFQ